MGDVIYNSTWYALTIEQQKDVMHLLNRKQNGVCLAIGPFSTLNHECCNAVSTFYNIIKLIAFLSNDKSRS